MNIAQLEHDLQAIRAVMEQSAHYTNIPTMAQFTAGILGLTGFGGTLYLTGVSTALNLDDLPAAILVQLGALWCTVFGAALVSAIAFSWLQARRRGLAAWNSLASRMFLSQLPLAVLAATFTLGLFFHGTIALIPAFWLGCYGVILESFAYFTGRSHRIEGIIFLALGILALFSSGLIAICCLGFGFGGIHLADGVYRTRTTTANNHESN